MARVKNAKTWRAKIWEKELNNVIEILENAEFSEKEVEYFLEYKQQIEDNLLEECLLTEGEFEDE